MFFLKKINRRSFLFFLTILGPGIITACADNDAGGITTYSVCGAVYGYKMLWLLFIITLCLIVIQEMVARMAVVTGKGLSDLIREEFGVRITFFSMLVLLLANLATLIAEFAGIAASLKIFGIHKYLSLPLIAFLIWILVIKGSYKFVERFFLILGLLFLTYVISAFLVKPDWIKVFENTFIPSFNFDHHFLLLSIAMVGTTVTPWMQFYLQSSIVDKGITLEEYKYEKADVVFGCLITDIVAFFIIVCCASTIYPLGITIQTAADAALALRPLAQKYASILFATGLFGASTLGAFILPLSTSYAICEAFGWESGINKKFSDAKVFYGLYTFLIIFGVAFILLPKISLIKVMLISQTINGLLLPPILILILSLVNNRRIMGNYTNSKLYNIIVLLTITFLIILTILLLIFTIL